MPSSESDAMIDGWSASIVAAIGPVPQRPETKARDHAVWNHLAAAEMLQTFLLEATRIRGDGHLTEAGQLVALRRVASDTLGELSKLTANLDMLARALDERAAKVPWDTPKIDPAERVFLWRWLLDQGDEMARFTIGMDAVKRGDGPTVAALLSMPASLKPLPEADGVDRDALQQAWNERTSPEQAGAIKSEARAIKNARAAVAAAERTIRQATKLEADPAAAQIEAGAARLAREAALERIG